MVGGTAAKFVCRVLGKRSTDGRDLHDGTNQCPKSLVARSLHDRVMELVVDFGDQLDVERLLLDQLVHLVGQAGEPGDVEQPTRRGE